MWKNSGRLFSPNRPICAHFTGRNRSDPLRRRRSGLSQEALRAIVEALCQDKDVPGKNLEQKINQLVEQKLLASAQADLLHEERYIGNAALHEILAPSKMDVIDGLEIIETLLSTLYVLPEKAERLRGKRERREALSAAEQPNAEDGSKG